ncbi:MAG: hypothetical protein MZV70_56850 [Desulfobacterales bacterium]|nr:hypothetical protein [Desulfobacterales bacterium]
MIADLYSNLGAFAAVEAGVAQLGPFRTVAGFAGIGLTRSLFLSADGVTSTPFDEAGGYASVWNKVDLLGLELPFRFGLSLSSSLELGPARLSFSAPFYSDPYYNRDFKDRSEDMNWLQFLDQETDETVISKISSFTDSLSLTGSLPAASLPPWLSSASLGRFTSSLAWSSVPRRRRSRERTTGTGIDVDPAREFFVPYEWTVLDAAISLSGAPFKYSSPKAGGGPATAGSTAARDGNCGGRLLGGHGWTGGSRRGAGLRSRAARLPGRGRSPRFRPWRFRGNPRRDRSRRPGPPMPVPGFAAPAIASPETVADRVPLSASMSWSMSPTFAWKRRFLTEAWTGEDPSSVDWSALYETRTLRNAGTVTMTGAVYDGLLGMTASLSASTQYQDRPRFSDDLAYASESLLATWARQDAQYRNDKVSATLKLSSSPFQDSWLWSPTGISYSLSSLLYEYAFEAMDPVRRRADPSRASYGRTWADWTDDTVSAHAARLRARPQARRLPADADGRGRPATRPRRAIRGAVNLKSAWSTLTVGTAYSVPAAPAPDSSGIPSPPA